MDELLQKAAEARGLPASLVERSAKARAEETGQPLEAVLAEWAGEAAPAADDAEDTTETPTEDSTASTEPAEDGVPGEITEDYLVGLASKAKRMPEKLIRTSATARAKHAGLPLEQVLAEWAGVDLDDLKTQAGTATAETSSDGGAAASPAEGEGAGGAASPPAPSATPEAPEAPEAPEPAAPVVDVDELLAKAAAARGVPAALTKRSAQARANEEGTSLEVVLAEWAGVKLPAAPAPAPKPEPEAAETEPAAEPEAADDAASEESEEPKEAPKPKGGIEVLEPVGGPIETDVHEVHEPVKLGRYPAWLAAAFLIIPLLAVTYILVSPNGPDCGSGGQLLVDPVSGEAVNCDGSAYGAVVIDRFANGATVYAQCAACHGADGSGGAGPAFAGGAVLETFPAGSCSDHREWVTLGTAGWPDPTYGATNKPVGGVGLMPGFGPSLSEEQIAEVALYERVQFGGEDLTEAQTDCGFDEEGAFIGAAAEGDTSAGAEG